MKRLGVLAIVLALLCGAAFAQDEGEDPNACFAGGSMEGKCALDGDGDGVLEDFEVDWAWTCGWYIAQFEANAIRSFEIPDWCNSVVPSPFRCFPSSYVTMSILFVGLANTVGNEIFFDSLDCTGPDVPRFSALIIADSLEEAAAICESFGEVAGINSYWFYGFYSAPENYYGCDLISLAPSGVQGAFRQ